MKPTPPRSFDSTSPLPHIPSSFVLDPDAPQELPRWLRDLHRRYGATAVDWLRFVRRNPEAMLRREFYWSDPEKDNWISYVHPWPAWLDPSAERRLATTATTVTTLIQSLPTRLFGDDAPRLAATLDLDAEETAIAVHYRQRKPATPLWTRGDFYDTEDGLLCLELNASSFLGGWSDASWKDVYLRHPLIRRFLDEHGLTVRPGGQSLDYLFRSTARRAWDDGLGAKGELNLLMAVRTLDQITEVIRFDHRDAIGELWQATLLEIDPNLRGAVTLGPLAHTDLDGLTPRFEGRDQHILVEFHDDITPEPLRHCLDAGGVHVYNGPSQMLLRSKLHLALLHEYADTDAFNDDERRQIRAYIPWSARVRRDRPLPFRDATGDAESVLLHHREDLVLKKGRSSSGRGVHVGHFTEASEWKIHVRQALDEPGWMVQERIEGLPLLLQSGDRGASLHDVAWGLFTFGSTYGGGNLRVRPSDPEVVQRGGVVNVSQGALESALLVAERRDP